MSIFSGSGPIFKDALPPVIPVARPGYPFIAGGIIASLFFALMGLAWLTGLGFALTLFVIWFFRDPERFTPDAADAVISPADGKVIYAGNWKDTPFEKGDFVKISIFMSVFNVHVNRVPCDGNVVDVMYHPGRFFSANLDKASEENERNAIKLETSGGDVICFVQIAGLIARRIISELVPGNNVVRGERFGMIRFGSRVDVYLPHNVKPSVSVGDKVSAGVSVLGYFNRSE